MMYTSVVQINALLHLGKELVLDLGDLYIVMSLSLHLVLILYVNYINCIRLIWVLGS